MKLVSWNCRCMGGKKKTKSIRELLYQENPSLLLIQETKLLDIDLLDLKGKFWENSIAQEPHVIYNSINVFHKNGQFTYQNRGLTQTYALCFREKITY